MKTKAKNTIVQNNIVRIAIGTLAALTIPLVAKWPWTLEDFVIMGILIFSTGLAYELIVKRVGKKHQIIIAIALLIAFLLMWAELAVGLFGTPFAGS